MSPRAVAVYRLLLRARADAFRGDARALNAACTEIRSKFELVRLSGLARGTPEAQAVQLP